MNAEPRKRQLKGGRNALWHFYLLVPYALPSLATGLKTTVHIPSVEPRSLVPDGAEQTLFINDCIYVF